MHPSISVVVPVYNAAHWIRETLDSVVAQTSPPDEVVVVDDGSTDDLDRALEPYIDGIELIRQENRGCGTAFNTGIANARCEFVALCPADDVWAPEKLAWQRTTLRAHPEVDVSFTSAVNFGIRTDAAPAPSRPGIQDPAVFAREMFVQNVIPDPSVVLRRSLHQRLGGFVPDIGEDYEFWFRALAEGAVFHYDTRVGVRLRQHGGNLSANAAAIWRMVAQVHATHAGLLDDQAFTDAVRARDLRRLGRALAGLGDARGARAAYRDAHVLGHRRSDRLRVVALGAPVVSLPLRAAARFRR